MEVEELLSTLSASRTGRAPPALRVRGQPAAARLEEVARALSLHARERVRQIEKASLLLKLREPESLRPDLGLHELRSRPTLRDAGRERAASHRYTSRRCASRISASCAPTVAFVSLYSLAAERPVALVFLRHLGCIFCRRASRDSTRCPARRERRVRHDVGAEASPPASETWMRSPHVFLSDPERRLYERLRHPPQHCGQVLHREASSGRPGQSLPQGVPQRSRPSTTSFSSAERTSSTGRATSSPPFPRRGHQRPCPRPRPCASCSATPPTPSYEVYVLRPEPRQRLVQVCRLRHPQAGDSSPKKVQKPSRPKNTSIPASASLLDAA